MEYISQLKKGTLYNNQSYLDRKIIKQKNKDIKKTICIRQPREREVKDVVHEKSDYV